MNKKRITTILAFAILLGIFTAFAQGGKKQPIFSVKDFGAIRMLQ